MSFFEANPTCTIPHTAAPKERVVVLAICKNEARILQEWLQHYRNEGVCHFVVIDNGSSDDSPSILRSQSDVTLVEDPTRHAQVMLYNTCFERHIRGNYDWVVVVDLDEFMYARAPHATLQTVLQALPDDVGNVFVPWKLFGSSGHVAHPEGRVVDNFLSRLHFGEKGINVDVKGVSRVKAVERIAIHDTKVAEGYVNVNASLAACANTGIQLVTAERLERAALALNHYVIQSEEYFRDVKMTRGAADNRRSDNVRDMSYFSRYDHKDVTDTELSKKIYFS